MQNKKLNLIITALSLSVAATAFNAGRLLNRGVRPLGLLEILANGARISNIKRFLNPWSKSGDPEMGIELLQR